MDQIADKDKLINDLNNQMVELRNNKQAEIDRHLKQASTDRASWEREKKTLEQ